MRRGVRGRDLCVCVQPIEVRFNFLQMDARGERSFHGFDAFAERRRACEHLFGAFSVHDCRLRLVRLAGHRRPLPISPCTRVLGRG